MSESKTTIGLGKDGNYAIVNYSQVNGIEVDGVESISHETLNHEFNHAKDILDGTLEHESNELSPGQAEIRAVQSINKIRNREAEHFERNIQWVV